MVVKKVVPIAAVVSPPDISWCFKPLFMWMRILGIELDPTCNPLNQITYFYGILLLITCQWASISLTAKTNVFKISSPVSLELENANVSKSTTYDWNVRIDVINHFSLMSIVCPTFFYIAYNNQRWLRLLDVMKTFHFVYCKINRGRTLRNFLLVGFLPILSEIGIMICIFHTKLEIAKASIYHTLVWFFALVAKLAPISALVLFYSVAWQSAAFYGEIRRDVERNLTTKVKQENIRKWKRSLSLVDELVDRINNCFGLILLVSITHLFVEFIARSFYLVSSITRNQLDILAIVSMLSRIFLLWLVVYCPAKIHHSAIKVAISLRKIDVIDTDVKSQISFLTIDIIQNSPRISALGYFDVNVQLIPKLVGTTLTYLVILYQFQTSENDN